MRNYNTTKTDNSKTTTFKSESTSKRIIKKVGHKGDYAVVKTGNTFITSVTTGKGTTGEPYIYTVDLSSDLTSDLATKRTNTDTLKDSIEAERIKMLSYRQKIRTTTKDREILSFLSLINITNSSSVITNTEIANNTNINYSIQSFHNNKGSLNNNNAFSINISKSDAIPKTVKGIVDLAGYDVYIISKNKNEIKFKITYNNIDVTNYHLLDESDLTISFVIEW